MKHPHVAIPVRTRLPAVIADVMWLKADRKFTLIQVLGFTVLNLFILGAGLTCVGGTIEEVRDGDLSGYFMLAIGLVPVSLGLRGLLNTYRSL